jgi:hypothetical protein
MWVKIDRFRHLTADERNLTMRSAVILPIIGLCLRAVGFQRTYGYLDRLTGTEPGKMNGDRAAGIQRAADSVLRAANHLPLYRPTCLPLSLMLWYLLRGRGVPAELRIGVRKTNGVFTAHAWVEHAGQVVNDAPDVAQRYVPVDLPESLVGARW